MTPCGKRCSMTFGALFLRCLVYLFTHLRSYATVAGLVKFLELDDLRSRIDHPLFPGGVPRYHSFTEARHPVTGVKYTFDEWNEHFPRARRQQHKRAWEENRNGPRLDKQAAAKWCKIDMFVRREKFDKCGQWYAARVISAQKPKVTAFTGPVITVVQDWLHNLWNWRNVPILFAAGCSTTELSGFYREMLFDKMFETDTNNFDSTVHIALHLQFLKLLHASAFEDERHFWPLRYAQAGELLGACETRFLTPGNIKSGITDTCLCNMFWNVCLHLYAIACSGKIFWGRWLSQSSQDVGASGDGGHG